MKLKEKGDKIKKKKKKLLMKAIETIKKSKTKEEKNLEQLKE